MAPVYGRNGFSDCKLLCDPKNGYTKQSCDDQCKGILEYNYSNKVTTTLSLPTPTPTPTLSSVTAKTYNTNDTSTGELDYLWIVSIVISLSILIILAICFRKKINNFIQSMIRWATNIVCQISQGRERETIVMQNLKVESFALLNSRSDNPNKTDEIFHTSTETGKTKEHVMDITKNTAELNATVAALNAAVVPSSAGLIGPKHYDDDKYHMIRHDSNANNKKTDSESGTDNDNEDGNNTLASTGNKANGKVKSKGTVRVITEINLR